MDIQQLITQASETMLTSGSVMPLIQLELSGNSELPSGRVIIMALDILSDEQSIPVQCGILARLGLETCRKYPGEKPIAASFYSEAWAISEPDNDAQRMRPKLDPKRREIIITELWQQDQQPQSFTLPVIRDHKNRVVDIGPSNGPRNGISWQLASFLQGVHDSQKSNTEVISRMQESISKRIVNMSPEQKQKSAEMLKSEGLPEGILDVRE